MRIIIAIAVVLSAVIPAAAQSAFRAGYAEIDVTPAKPMPMWGYGDRHDMLSVGMRDPLMANCVVIQGGESKVALVGLDIGRSLGEPHFARIREAVKAASGVDHIMMSGSHTHHGPVLELRDVDGMGKGKFDDGVAYVGELEAKMIEVINAAAANLQDAKIGWGSAELNMNRNRHSKREPKPRDPELAVIRLDGLDGSPIALVVNFAGHPVSLNPADLRWSADYPGAMKRTLSEAMDAPAVFMQGAAGDMSINSAPEHSMKDDDPALANPELTADQLACIEAVKAVAGIDDAAAAALAKDFVKSAYRMEAFGKALGEEAAKVAKTIETAVPETPSVEGDYEIFEFESRLNFQNPVLVAMFAKSFFPELAKAASADVADNIVRAALTTVVINDELALVGGSGEFFCNHSNRLKERSYADKTLFFGYCNGHNMYFPTIEAASEGGYGADAQVSWVELSAGEQMMDKALINIYEMLGKLTTERTP